MKIIQKGFELPKLEYYQTHLKIVNAILPIGITSKEIEILSWFLTLPKSDTMFSTPNRKAVIKALSLTDGGMSNHLKNMKKKGLLKREDDNLVIVPALLPDERLQGYNLKIKIKKDETTESGANE